MALSKKSEKNQEFIESHRISESVSSASFTQQSTSKDLTPRSTYIVIPRRISFDTEVHLKLSDNLVSVMDEKNEDFDDYSYIDRLNSSINKSLKLNTSFKSRTLSKPSDGKFELTSHNHSEFKEPTLMTSFHHSPLKRCQTTFTSKRPN